MLRALSELSKRSLLTAINDAIMENNIPEAWRIINNFRQISLISVLLKLSNLTIKDEINSNVEHRKLIPAKCYVYRKGRSSANCINELIHKKSVLDIANASNCVRIDLLVPLLDAADIDPDLVNAKFLSNKILKLGVEKMDVKNSISQIYLSWLISKWREKI